MKLRPYKSSDLESVANLFTTSIHGLAIDHYNATQRAAWAPQPPDLSEWDERLNGLHTVVAEDNDNELAGFLSYAMNGYIGLLCIASLYPRRGVASFISRDRIHAIVRGCRSAIHRSGVMARPFFHRQGFLIAEEQIVSRRGATFKRYAMRKSIKADG